MSNVAAIEFVWSSQDLEVWRDRKVEKAVARALSKSGTAAIRNVKVSSNRYIRARKRMMVKRVNDALPLTFPITKSIDGMEWRMDVSGHAFRVSDFPYRQTKRGVTVTINTGKRVLIHGAFVATMKSGHTGVFTRRGKVAERRGSRGQALPIDEAFTTRITDVFHDTGMVSEVMFRAQTVFSREFERLLPYELKKVAKP